MMSFREVAAQLESAVFNLRPALEADLFEIGEEASSIAREMIGHESPQWAPLAPNTIAEKTRLGYVGQVSATDPLLRTGELRDSIKIEVADLAVTVGSEDEIAAFQEYGTSRIPPRPFLAPGILDSMPVAEKALGKTAVALLTT